MSRRRPTRATLAGLGATALLGALPGLAMTRLYSGARAAPLVVGAALAASAIVAARLRWSPKRARLIAGATTHVAGFVVYALAAAGARAGLGTGLVHGWARLLSTAPPLNPDADLLIPALVLVWAAAAGGGELWVRTETGLGAAAPAGVALLAGAILAGGHEAPSAPLGAAFLLGCGILLAAATQRANRLAREGAVTVFDRRARRHAKPPWAAAGLAVAVVAVGAGAGPALQLGRDKHAFDPRQHIDPPLSSLSAISPLDLIASRLDDPSVPMFAAHTTQPLDWQLAVLDRFDGYDWTASDPFVATGSQLPPEAGRPAATNIGQRVTVQQLTGPWLPAARAPSRVSGVAFEADPQTGVLIDTRGTARGASYRVVSAVPDVGASALLDAPAANTPEAMADLELAPGTPVVLSRVATVATTVATTPFLRALALERYLRANYTLDPRAGAGHSYGHLVRFLTQTKRGTSEQFATAFAVLGRAMGLPTRVVVGFSPGTQISPGVWQVRSGDAAAWPEVDFAGVGWVQFNPTPPASGGSGDGPLPVGGPGTNGEQNFVLKGTNPPTVSTTAPAPESSGVAPARSIPRHPAGGSMPIGMPVAAAALVAVAAGAGGIVVAKRRHSAKRRRNGTPRDRVAGAWAEVLDRLAELGCRHVHTMTVAEVIEASERYVGARRGEAVLAGLYRPVNQALFSAEEPTELAAKRAWRSYDGFDRLVARRRSHLQRIRATVDPRPLIAGWRRRTSSRKEPSWG